MSRRLASEQALRGRMARSTAQMTGACRKTRAEIRLLAVLRLAMQHLLAMHANRQTRKRIFTAPRTGVQSQRNA